MAAPTKPEVNKEENKESNSQTQDTQKTTKSQESQPTDLVSQAAILAEMRRMNEENRAMRAEIDEMKKPKEEKKEAPDFFKDPKAHFDGIADRISNELKETVKPLIDFKNRVESGDALTAAKNKVKNASPQVKAFLSDPEVEAAVDQIIRSGGKANITEQDVIGAVAGVKGAMELGMIPNRTTQANKPNNETKKETKVDTTLPPHLRPSSAPGPTDQDDPNKPERELNELERRLARENNMTDAEYLAGLKMHPLDVVKAKKRGEK